jgi:hypothetical protein
VFNGNPVQASYQARNTDLCDSGFNGVTYRADVTTIVTGNGGYAITLPTTTGRGASLLVMFNDGVSSNNVDVVVFDGNESNRGDLDRWEPFALSGINYNGGTVRLQLHVAEGQSPFLDSGLSVFDPAGAEPANRFLPAGQDNWKGDCPAATVLPVRKHVAPPLPRLHSVCFVRAC